MENVIGSVFSGLFDAIGKLFHSPLDFLAGKSCSSVCGSTWDLICYIENFCVANLLKLIMVLVLSYIVLLYLYLLYKVGICQCITHGLCRMAWGCISCWFSSWEFCCTFLCYKLRNVKRINRRRGRRKRRVIEHHFDTSEEYDDGNDDGNDDVDDGRFAYDISGPMEASNHSQSGRLRNYKAELRRSLRPRSHRTKVGISRDGVYKRKPSKHMSSLHDIRVTYTSKFAHKGSSYRGRRARHSRRSNSTR